MNSMAIAWGQDAVVIDAGLMFPDDSMPGVDLVVPDPDFLSKLGWRIHGIAVTHGHEDHIGGIPYLLKALQIPLYATSFTMGLIEYKLEEFDMLACTERHVISSDSEVTLGPFRLRFFPVCHSISDAVGIVISTPMGTVVHSGDFKMDPEPLDGRICDLKEIVSHYDTNVFALLSDSTNVENEGRTGSERSIRPTLERLFRGATGRILFATFSSNVQRIQQVLELSEQFDRKVILVGRSMETVTRIASERGYLNVPAGLIADIRELDALSDHEVTILSTGSQGEPMSALSLMAYDKHKYLSVKEDDLLILSSRFIPGNERAINRIINEFTRRGAQVEYEKVANVHVSGHARQDELRLLIRALRPRYFVPVHGEYRHLVRHAQLAEEEGIPKERIVIAQDGDLIRFKGKDSFDTDRMDVGWVFVDGRGVGDVCRDILRGRRALSEKGVVIVVLTVDGGTGEPAARPQIISQGVTGPETEPQLLAGIQEAVENTIIEINPGSHEQWEEAREQIRLTARRHVNKVFGRKPLVQTVLTLTEPQISTARISYAHDIP
jgi:ribonuclease J